MDASALVAGAFAPLTLTLGFFVWGKYWLGSAYALNLFKCTFGGLLFLLVATCIRTSELGRFATSGKGMPFLMLSSLLGIFLGDNAWLLALQMIGPTRVIIIDSLKPGCAALLATLLLNEECSWRTWFGIALSSLGVLLVSTSSLPREAAAVLVAEERIASPPNSTKHALEKAINEIMESKMQADKATFIEKKRQGKLYAYIADELQERGFDTAHLHLTKSPPLQQTQTREEGVVHDDQKEKRNQACLGFVLAFVNVLFDAYGSVLTKQYSVALNTFEISAIRFVFSALLMICLSILLCSLHLLARARTRQARNATRYTVLQNYSNIMFSIRRSDDGEGQEAKADVENNGCVKEEDDGEAVTELSSEAGAKDTISGDEGKWYLLPSFERQGGWRGYAIIIVGCLLVTFTCPSLGTFALLRLPLAVSQTLSSLSPLYALPIAAIVEKKQLTIVSVLAACLAVGGVIVVLYA